MTHDFTWLLSDEQAQGRRISEMQIPFELLSGRAGELPAQ
jgi:hypothetical protein